jgi:hypothetical protein
MDLGKRNRTSKARVTARTVAGVLLAACGGALATLGGCYGEGGSFMSVDRGRIVSRALEPKTVSIIDTRTDKVVFTIDIPVDADLLYAFQEGGGDATIGLPDTFAYEVWPRDRSLGVASNKAPVPQAEVRRLEWKYRPAPELPGALQPAKPLPTRPKPPVPPPGATE